MAIRNLLKPDISIIGSGIIGDSFSLSLQRKGFQVQVFDKNQSIGFGTTSYSSGICLMYYSLPVSAKFSWEWDFLAMDVHETHCNTEIKGKTKDYTRLSVVCYLRNNIIKCK